MYVLLLFQSCSRFYRAGIGIVKKIGFTYVLAKSPIIHLKMLFPKPPKSDLAGGLVYITKKHLERCISTNGAAGKNRTCDPVITNDVLYH